MKKIILLMFLFAYLSLNAQSFILTKDSKTGKPMLKGLITKEAFQDSNFSWWYNSEYNFYRVDSTVLNKINPFPKDISFMIVMGTWCSDSRREVPRFYKILEYLRVPENRITIYAVDRKKKDLRGETDKLNIELVPTFIVLKENKEIGKIIEAPEETLEKDLANIILK